MKALVTAALFAMASLASAQYGGSGDYGRGGSGNPFSGSGSGSGSSGGSSGFPFSSGDSSFLGFNVNTAETYRLAHGVMASLAFVVFFPVGAISIRIIPGRFALLLHVAFQMLAYALYICAFALGIWMVTHIKFEGFDFVSNSSYVLYCLADYEQLGNSSTNYHPIIGIVVFALLFFQPISGFVHHHLFKKHQRRQAASYAHLWLGRTLITLGIINGGLGLRLADNTRKGEIAYGIVAGVIWLVWMAAAVLGEIKRGRKAPAKEVSPTSNGKGPNGDYYA